MSDLKLFRIDGGQASELTGSAATLEKSLQTLIEQNMETLLGVRFLRTEYSTGARHAGRIDSLGIDENGCPVILEYKRTRDENVINQGLFYLDWLMDHKAEFKLLVMDLLGTDEAEKIDWSAPRLLCIAGEFTRYDEHAVQQINRNIELIRYRRFGEELLLLDLVNAVSASPANGGGTTKPGPSPGPSTTYVYKTISETLDGLTGPLKELYEETRIYLESLGDDVQVKTLKYYVAFKRLKNFACVEVHTGRGWLTVFVKGDPDAVTLEEGFTRDVREVGHYGTGDIEIKLREVADLERAKDLIQSSYEAS